MQHAMPPASGLYDPRFEHDACGVSFVVDIKGRKSHDIVAMGIGALCSMEHRGATGAEVETGDGAGVLIQIPHRFLSEVVGFVLPAEGSYGVGVAFLPADKKLRDAAVVAVERIIAEQNLDVLGWREVPVDPSCLGKSARDVMPAFSQIFIADMDGAREIELDRKLFIARKRIEHELPTELQTYFPSLSCRTLIYKGMLTTPQLAMFFPDLTDARIESAIALVHSRFSTNTFPSWPLAHPYRFIAHNGEINTVQGNRNWMRTRESLLSSNLLPGLERAFPICAMGGSDSASFDEVLELLHLGGRSLPHAVMMMIPEAWENNKTMSAEKRAFYRFHASLMEPWDGPACIAFTDGTLIGAVLDR
ncbi:MAG: glutamate synthase subunit alpha, partial [Actinomycetota bacterium]